LKLIAGQGGLHTLSHDLAILITTTRYSTAGRKKRVGLKTEY